MSPQVTEGHRELLHQLLMNVEHGYLKEAAQLIADSEALAVAEIAMVAAASADRNVSLRLERDQLRAEIDRLHAINAVRESAIARAELAEADADSTRERALTLANSLDEAQAELATERAKYNQLLSALVYADQILDDIDTCSDAHKPMYSSYSQNVFKLCIKGRDARRASIDAAMKEGA